MSAPVSMVYGPCHDRVAEKSYLWKGCACCEYRNKIGKTGCGLLSTQSGWTIPFGLLGNSGLVVLAEGGWWRQGIAPVRCDGVD
ncbi:hypothetical protein VNO80_23133 [Phaseolus coccineus]|uniref:Uncharacterized protein n=1 Tax=Phaseolus coccineus TaxID=3886 RepID=A0AAN9QUZ2_PHACN